MSSLPNRTTTGPRSAPTSPSSRETSEDDTTPSGFDWSSGGGIDGFLAAGERAEDPDAEASDSRRESEDAPERSNGGPPLLPHVRSYARELEGRGGSDLQLPDHVLRVVARHAPDKETAGDVLDLAWQWARVPWWALEEIRENDGDGLAVAVYVAVRSFADFDGSEARPKHREVARRAGCGRRTVIRRLKFLREVGVLDSESRREACRSNVYSVPLQPPASIEADNPDLFARVPLWALELIGAVEDSEIQDPDGPEDRERRVRADGRAVAALTALRKRVEFTGEGESAEEVPPTANTTLLQTAGIGKNDLNGRLKALRRMGLVSWPERESIHHAHRYEVPIYPSDSHVLYLVGTIDDRAQVCLTGDSSVSDRGWEVCLIGDTPRASTKSHDENTSCSRQEPTGTFGREEGREPALRGSKLQKQNDRQEVRQEEERNEDTDSPSPADSSSGAGGAETKVDEWGVEVVDESHFPRRDDPVQVSAAGGAPVVAFADEDGDGTLRTFVRAGERPAVPLPGYVGRFLPSAAFSDGLDPETAEFFAALPSTLGPHPETGRPVKVHCSEIGPFVLHREERAAVVPTAGGDPGEHLRALDLEDAVEELREEAD